MVNKTIIDLNTAIHDTVIELLANEPRGSLVDLGAGDGTLVERLRSEGFEVTAVDAIADDFRPADIKVVEADLNGGLPFTDALFKVVVSTEVIEHLENPWFFVRELYRVIQPGGVAIVSTPNLSSIYVRAWYLLTGHLYNFLQSAYSNIGHITPVYLWNLERMAEGKFDIEAVRVNASPIPKTSFLLPLRSLLFGQCIVVKLRRRGGVESAAPRVWTNSRIVRRDAAPSELTRLCPVFRETWPPGSHPPCGSVFDQLLRSFKSRRLAALKAASRCSTWDSRVSGLKVAPVADSNINR